MSTEIRITLEGENLSDTARQNQQRNRQTEAQRVERQDEARATAKTEAAQKKEEEQKKAAGQSSTSKFRPDEPAANRLAGVGFVLVPSENFDAYGVKVLSRAAGNKRFVPLASRDGTISQDVPAYSYSGGPGDGGYLSGAELRPTSTQSPSTRYITQLAYPICADTNVAGGIYPSQVLTFLTGEGGTELLPISARQISKPLHTQASYTVECFLYSEYPAPTDLTPFPRYCLYTDISGYKQVNQSCEVLFTPNLNQVSVQLLAGRFSLFGVDLKAVSGYDPVPQARGQPIGKPTSSSMTVRFNNYAESWVISKADLAFNAWHHFAITSDNGVLTAYINGVALLKQSTPISLGTYTTYSSANVSWQTVSAQLSSALAWATIYTVSQKGEGLGVPPGWTHSRVAGFRYTPKVLYRGNFTVPPFIRSLG